MRIALFMCYHFGDIQALAVCSVDMRILHRNPITAVCLPHEKVVLQVREGSSKGENLSILVCLSLLLKDINMHNTEVVPRYRYFRNTITNQNYLHYEV